MFQGLRWRLLLSYLTVMATILSAFGMGVYVFFSRNLYRQLDKKLLTLAQSAAPSFAEVEQNGSEYLDQVDKVPWRDIFNRDRQSLEWFDDEANSIGNKGFSQIEFKPRPGAVNIPKYLVDVPIRAYTISVFKDSEVPNKPTLEGYIRASQSIEEIETVQHQLLWVLSCGGIVTLILSGLGGMWLTQKAIEPIEASYFKLKQFTADASHELRGPLTAIKFSVDIIRNHPERIHPKDSKKLTAIASATSQMGQLIEDLLFLARTDKEVIVPTREKIEISLSVILQNLFILLEPVAQNKKISLKSQLTDNLIILGDKSKLSRLFSNLIHNAIQYTPEGGIVTIELSKQNRHAMVNVRDTGIGIAEDQLPNVFDRFWRADKARSRREGGTGLGLSIAKAIAVGHGGRINVTSKPNVGSCFQVRIPLINRSNTPGKY
ncbi:Integral membrane sensor signal transduction histidine kinase [Hyella patelloides LEGE 07179]|uniref:histidine kinase n=1 Tax=Hyella patelloides LEGE 07179 TaxID=945734 RepID=A0A563VT55_9CYAN|nr:Integral membrane sensor signal transduction histidine kinase [Hyella patelloides LEGE 07179]